MQNRKILLPALFSIVLVFSLILPASATVPLPDDYSVNHLAIDCSSAASAMALNMPQGNVMPMVAGGSSHTVGLKANGTVVAVGENKARQCDVGSWRGIVQVAAGGGHTVGLKSYGTVVAVGCVDYRDPYFGDVICYQQGQCDVGGWTEITQIAAGVWHTVGLKSDGTVVAVGQNDYGSCDVVGWTNIIQVAAGHEHTVGLKSNGTVVAVGDSEVGQCDVGNWTDITQVAAGSWHTVGLKSDGTVVAVGYNKSDQCNVSNWTNIVQVAAGAGGTLGLKPDGTVVAVGSNSYGQFNIGGWTDIVQVAAGGGFTVGLKSDGTVVAMGANAYGQCNVGNWNLKLAKPINWPLIGGIIAGVVAVGLVIFFMRRRRQA